MSGNGHGGRRPGAGRPAGSKNPVTLLREARAEELVRLGRDRLGAMLEVVADIAEDPEAPPGVRLAAANSFLDRLAGRAARMGYAPHVLRDKEDARRDPSQDPLSLAPWASP